MAQRRSVLDASRRQAAPLAQMQQAQAKLLCRLQSFGEIRAFRKDDVLIRQGFFLPLLLPLLCPRLLTLSPFQINSAC